jgi:hypothetical protein
MLRAFRFSVGMALSAALLATPIVQAGPLATHPDAIPGFSGSTVFDSDGIPNNGSLQGYVEFAVFAPGDYPVGLLGYSPTAGQAVYAYQVFVDDQPAVISEPPVSVFSVDLINDANNIGSFSGNSGNGIVSGDVPTSATLNALINAEWHFTGIGAGATSEGLAFSSPNIPMMFFGAVVDTGESAFVVPLPSPDAFEIPEPGSMTVGLVAVGLSLVRRRRNVA